MTRSRTRGPFSAPLLQRTALLSLLLAACSSTHDPAGDADVDPGDASSDAGSMAVPDADVDAGDLRTDAGDTEIDAGPPAACSAGAVCGTVSYSGAYTGPEAMVYVRVYMETGSASQNPTAALGSQDFLASRDGTGHYEVDLGGYEGTVFVSAFMDVDASGPMGGPTARATMTDGLYSDPMGAHGGYTFEGDPSTEPTAVVVTDAGVTGIDITLADSGVISGTISAGARGGSGAVVVGAFVPELTGAFLHHTDIPTFTDGMTYLVAMPAGEDWRIRTTVGGNVGFYPRNPPPPPPTNTTPVTVTANNVTDGIDITLASFGMP